MNKELVKLAFKLGYKQTMEKRADPPNKGLHDPNPLKREVYKRWGYVAPSKKSYFASPETSEDAEKQYQFAEDWLQPQIQTKADTKEFLDRWPGEGEDFSWFRQREAKKVVEDLPENRAAWFDFERARGDIDNAWYRPRGGITESAPGVVIGSYPFSSEPTVAHEYGHVQDHINYDAAARVNNMFRKFRSASGSSWEDNMLQNSLYYPRHVLESERRAWELGGIPANHPQRVAALKTYEKGSKDSLDNFIRTATSFYHRPELVLPKFKQRYPNIYQVYDYNSAFDAARNGFDLSPYGAPNSQ